MQNDHPLALEKTVGIEDLADCTIVVPAGIQYREFEVGIRSFFARDGIVPHLKMLPANEIVAFELKWYGKERLVLERAMPKIRGLSINSLDSIISKDVKCEHLYVNYFAANNDPSN